MAESEQTLVAYLAVHNKTEGKNRHGYIGGVLVIDGSGIPHEFRSTRPLWPTPVQRAIYGRALEPYVFNELIGAPLVQSLATHPQWCIVEDFSLLDLRQQVDLPVLHMEGYRSASSGRPGTADAHRLESDIEGVQPVGVRTHRDFASDYDAVCMRVQQLFKQIDPLEPFRRIATAVDSI